MISIDYQDGRPIYEQIVERYKNLIVRGALEADEQMPSVRSLAMELSINPNTIQKAYGELERQGYIYTVKGRGCFVSSNTGLRGQKQEEILSKLDQLLEEAREADIAIDVLREHLEAAANMREVEG